MASMTQRLSEPQTYTEPRRWYAAEVLKKVCTVSLAGLVFQIITQLEPRPYKYFFVVAGLIVSFTCAILGILLVKEIPHVH